MKRSHLTYLLPFLMNTQACDLGQPVPELAIPKPDTRPRDRGAGVLFFLEHGAYSSNFRTDSMAIFKQPFDSSDRVATFIQEIQAQGYRYYVPELPVNGYANAIEYGYEVVGLPFDSVNATQQWFRVIYGMMEPEAKLIGWVKLTPPKNDKLFWADVLLTRSLFFSPRPDTAEFFDSPGGNRVFFALERSYIMHPLQRDSLWLQVLVVTPSDMCDDPENPATGTFWIRYINSDGRPLVFYYSRGC